MRLGFLRLGVGLPGPKGRYGRGGSKETPLSPASTSERQQPIYRGKINAGFEEIQDPDPTVDYRLKFGDPTL